MTFYTVCISTLTASLLILAVVLLRALFHRRIRMRLQYALWLLVAVRLLIMPVPLLESPLSVLRLMDTWRQPQNDTADSALNDLMQSANTPADSTNEPKNLTEERTLLLTPQRNSAPQSVKAAWTWERIGRICFLTAVAGSGIVFVYFVIGNIRFVLSLRRKRIPYADDTLPLPVYLVESLPSPCIYGHAIYIAPAMAEDKRKLSHILTHEYCHYRQGDSLWSIVRCLCVILYWWNPLVWLAAYLSRLDCELSCDEAALHLLGDGERLSYGRTLIELIPVKNQCHYCSIATTMSKGGRSMKTRIYQIAANPKATSSVCVLLAALALICFVSMSTTASTLPGSDTESPEDSQIVTMGEPTHTYTLQVDESEDYFDLPKLFLNEDEHTFQFHISLLSSYLIFGTYELQDDILIATTSDGSYQYRFQVADETTLIFLEGSVFSFADAPPIGYGSKFCLSTASIEPDTSIAEDASASQAPTDTQETNTQAVHDLDEAVRLAVLSYNRSRYTEEECTGEGHLILDEESADSETVVYALTMYGEYQFQDNALVKEAGSGIIPAVMTFTYDVQEGYVLTAYDEPEDGSFYVESIHELFPESLWDRCISQTEEDYADLLGQEQAYAVHYLQQIGREATVGSYGDYEHTLLTDAGVSVEVSNLMCEYEKYDGMWKYPDWIGNREYVEDGVRYVYAMDLDNEAHEIIYTKSVYGTDTVVETHIFDSLTGEQKQ